MTTTKLARPDLAAGALCSLCVIGIVLLAALHLPIPDVLTFLAMGALGIGGGTALTAGAVVTQPPAPEPAPAALAAAPAPLTEEPPTGVLRISTHAP